MVERRRAGPWAAIVLLGSLASCATYADRTRDARDAFARGDVDGGLRELDRYMKVKDPGKLPTKWKKDTALAVLERATALQASRRYDLSARDFQVADKALELLDIHRDAAGKIGQYVYSDSAPKYRTSPTEKLSLNAMNMVNYLVRGDLEGAKVEARRFTVMRKYLSEIDPDREHGAFGSYLAGFVFERLGDAEEALRYYDEALLERDFATLVEPVRRLARKSSYRGRRLAGYVPDGAGTAPEPAPTQATGPGVAEVLVLAKIGAVPHKEARRIPIGAAVGLAGTFVTGDPRILEYSMFKVVTYPELVLSYTAYTEAQVDVDGTAITADVASELGHEIVAEYEKLRPKIVGAALTRMIARAAVAEGARAGGRQAEGAGGLIGFLAAAAVEGTLVALDKPDTRSWTTLPARVWVARATIPAGKHTINVTVSGPGGSQRRTIPVDLRPGGFAVLDVTTLR